MNDTEPSPPPDSSVPPPKPDPNDVPTEPDASPEPFPLPPEDNPPLSLSPTRVPDCSRCGKPRPRFHCWEVSMANDNRDVGYHEDCPFRPGAPKVFTGDAASLTRDKRPWHDWGKDTGPRLRVKGLVDRPGPPPVPEEERREWIETHERYKRARAEGDDHTVAKIAEPILDALHTETPPAPIPDLDWSELEPALMAELRRWGAAHRVRSKHLLFKRFFGDNACVRVTIDGNLYEARIDGLRARRAWKATKGDARACASMLVQEMNEAFSTTRATEAITVPDPELLSTH